MSSKGFDNGNFNIEDCQVIPKEATDIDPYLEKPTDSSNKSETIDNIQSAHIEPNGDNNSTSSNSTVEDGNTKYNFTPVENLEAQKIALQLPDPFYMLCFFDQDINEGKVTLYKWQRDVQLDLAQCRHDGVNGAKATSNNPYKYCLLASNGSGKDKFVIAPWAVFFMLTKVRSRVIITTSSGTQLTGQTEPYIKDLCDKINKYFGTEIFKIRQRYIYCTLSGSECRMFATDEAGKAEGYHPIDANSEMCIIVNEGKSVTEDIHKALRRCTGYNYWIECSSAGQPKGYLHWAYNNFPNRKRVTTYDCPHQNLQDLEEDKIQDGEASAYFRSKHLSLFTSVDGQVVISVELVENTLKLYNSPDKPTFTFDNWPKRIGIDLAAGGDENAICICKGNKVLKEIYFRERYTTITAARINQILKAENIPTDHAHIYADDGGIGHSIIDMLNKPLDDGGKYEWSINRINNQWAALGDKKRCGNRGAENWLRVARILEEKFFDLRGLSQRTLEQLYNRYFRQSMNNGRIYLQDKKEAKAQGFPSPDRADAFILSFTGLTVQDFLNDLPAKEQFIKAHSSDPRNKQFQTPQEVYEHFEREVTYKELDDLEKNAGKQILNVKRCYNSLRALINS